MSLTKKNISINIAKKSLISAAEGSEVLDLFLSLIKNNSKSKIVKISGFGSFFYKKTPQRIGRNPKTIDSYIIPIQNKLSFRPSNNIKGSIN